jgi:hypothetical protein
MRARAALLTVAALSLPAAAQADDTDHAVAARHAWSVDLFGTGFVGDGIRLNNPYRLATILGSQAESLSRTATYADVGGAVVFGHPDGLAHGLALRVSVALEGIQQSVVTPSYLAFHRWRSWAVYGRAGLPVVLSPDATWGMEGAAGGVWFVRAGVGVAAELVGDVFYGAGTREVATPAYPVLSGQAGLWLSWEALP